MAVIDQKLRATSPCTLDELWRMTSRGPTMPQKMWKSSQSRSFPSRFRIRTHLRRE
ncbi:MAG TPA: hypothetical protein VF789_04890 [Thermoanaerobaculia bacterium]